MKGFIFVVIKAINFKIEVIHFSESNGVKLITIDTPSGEVIEIGGNKELVLIAGPCAVESYDHCMKMAELIGKVCRHYKTKWIFKACLR